MITRISSFLFFLFGFFAFADPPANFDLTGRWESGCHKSYANVYVEENYDFRKDRFTREQKRFTDKDCATDALGEIRVYEGEYEVVGPARNIGPGARKVDFVISDVFVTPVGELVLKNMNQFRYCKITDWKRGVRREITGLLCSNPVIEAGTVIFDVVQKKDANLYFGEQSYFIDRIDPKSRPTIIDQRAAFVKW